MTDNPILSKVTDSEAAPPEDPNKAPWPLVVTGWAITIGLGILQFALIFPLEALADERFHEIVTRERALLWWREDALGFMPLVVVLFGLFLVVPRAHGGSLRGRDRAWSPRWRTVAIIGAVVAMAAATGMWVQFGGRAGGLAFGEGAGWFENGRVVERRPWSAATSIVADCDMVRSGRYHTGEPEPSFTYEVFFPGDRSALLSYGATSSAEWMETMAPIDRSLRTAGIRRAGVLNETCLREVAGPSVEHDALKALLAP